MITLNVFFYRSEALLAINDISSCAQVCYIHLSFRYINLRKGVTVQNSPNKLLLVLVSPYKLALEVRSQNQAIGLYAFIQVSNRGIGDRGSYLTIATHADLQFG